MGKIKEDFLSVRSLITLGAFFTIYGLTWFGKPVPETIIRIADMLLGFYFGSKMGKVLRDKNAENK